MSKDLKSNRIKILDDNLINLIAAGEIVERPASVVKELLENSLDAGAESIDIEIEAGGKKRIVVTDDGVGMSMEDAKLAIERHATSKVERIDDLKSIHTLGFRGEALPSIASVSRLTLFTKMEDSTSGCEIRLEGGKLKYVRDAGIPKGTRVIADDLFFSVPARRKFLKTEKTEYYHVLDVINRVAISRPDVRFRLKADGREVINVHSGSLRDRVGGILGKRSVENMEEVGFEAEGIKVLGLVGSPDDTRTTRSNIFIYVNDRYVRDAVVTSAIMRAYKGLIFNQRYPIAVLFIQLPYSDVDVNIHPTKIQVKFKDTQNVGGVVKRAVDEALKKSTTVKIAEAKDLRYQKDRKYGESEVGRVGNSGSLFFEKSDRSVAEMEPGVSGRSLPISKDGIEISGIEDFGETGGFKVLGQIKGTYIILERNEGLVIIDQHAAHERIIYEEIKAGYLKKNIPRQRLLFPMKIELPKADYEVILSNLEDIYEMGLEISDFGENTVIVTSVPAVIKDADVKELVNNISEELKGGKRSIGAEDLIDKIITIMACHGAVRAGRELGTEEIRGLVRSMEKTPYAAHCPHGRPTMFVISTEEIKRRFKRTN